MPHKGWGTCEAAVMVIKTTRPWGRIKAVFVARVTSCPAGGLSDKLGRRARAWQLA